MRFKTTIEIISDAKDKDEAMDIAGEYLSGNLVSGVNMKCITRPAASYAKGVVSVMVVLLLVLTATITVIGARPTHNAVQNVSAINAVQPPLKTAIADKKNADFKKEWQDKQNKEALNYIKR